ncbi:MAG: DUF4097 family beta strand repeat-containing protein [Bacteroidota bacterium]|jgi:hypothetical protein|nr:DUF4097 family beta strand repeat protein [Cytophagales bacterium]
MKNLSFSILFLCLQVGFLFGQNEVAVPLSDPNKRCKIKVHINYGSITIKGTARKDVLVKYTHEEEDENEHHTRRHPRASEGLKRIGSGGLDLEISEDANLIKVQSNSWNKKVNLTLEIPSAADVSAHTYNDGDLMVSNVQGDLELNDYNGSISAENISGSVVATSYNGEIKVTFDKVADGTPMSFSTFNGEIDLTFPSSLKATLKMKTDQGEILSSFDMKVVKNGPIQKKEAKGGVYKVVIDEWVKGDVNGGGPELTMKTYNGDIIIRKK